MRSEQEQSRAIELMVAYQSGELDAFESLYRILQPTLLQYLAYQTFDKSLAEDLLQECFLQLHRSRRSYMPGRPVLPWAIAIARNVFLMNRRARKRRERHETATDLPLPENLMTVEIEDLTERHFLREALARLTAEQREVLMMHHIWGLSFHEIGGILGIRQGAAKLRAHRAIKQLRTILDVQVKSNVQMKPNG